ncbi:hypothetical protein HID58_047434 [Brassica napus]|uniref:Ubiquitin-like protease family profile domain-containing protein n=1 Tax=Brassica napus TaxID=3708 RepID=A0ABQ8AZC0_BRANA|nr:hypothetical protein HID58_047434 [Brassica napus]
MEQTILPERMFAAGEEPAGDRINTYHKPKRIESILDALEPKEVDFLRQTSFGKIISLAENPSFSGSFGQFPLRMSLHEFAQVTGLNCSKIPKKNCKRKKNPIKEKLYWGELFRSLKFCLVDTAIEMLQKKKIKDREMRLNVTLPGFVDAIQLVFIAAVPQIRETVTPPEPVVVIDSDSESDSGDNESQVEEAEVVEAPPTKPETVRFCVNPDHIRNMDEECKVNVISMVVDTTHTPEELVWDDEVDDEAVDNLVRLIQEGHLFNKSMLGGGDSGDVYEPTHIANLFGRMVFQLIDDVVVKEGAKLEEQLAKVIKAELLNMQATIIQSIITHLGNSIPNTSSVKETTGVAPKPVGDCTFSGPPLQPTNISRGEVQKGVPTEPSDAQTSGTPQQVKPASVQPQVDKVINMVISEVEGLTELEEVVPSDDTTNPPLCCAAVADHDRNIVDVANTHMDIEFSTPLGVTGDEVQRTELIHVTVPALVANDDIGETRKSRRTRIPHPLFNDYQCNPKIITFRVEGPPPAMADNIDEIYISMRESVGQNKVFTVGNGISVTTDELNDIEDRTKQMPTKEEEAIHSSKIAIYDTNFPALLMKQHARLVNTVAKDRSRLKYDEAVLKYFIPPTSSVDAYDRIYFPFFIDKQHWIGVCLHLPESAVQVLDCNFGFRTQSMMKKDLNPITIVVPHILNTAMGNLGANQRKPYQMIRVKDVHQNHNSTDAAATTVLLIQAHAASDGDGCKEITRDSLAAGAKHLAVLVYRNVTPI